MRTSQNGINLIKQFEGCRLTAYKCPAGVPTIGYGHTAGVKMGQTITQVQAESFLKDDLVKFEQNVIKYNSKYNWNQNQFDAMVSFAFNIGSIDQLTDKGKRDIQTISKKMLEYNKITVGGKKVHSAGLEERRKKEQMLFLKPEIQNVQAASSDTEKKKESLKTELEHVQLNYCSGELYEIVVDGLRIRTKKASQNPSVLPNSETIGNPKKGTIVKNQATARVGDQIWMYIGLDKKGREQWICADTGKKAYVV